LYRNQIDNFTVNQRFKNSIKNVKGYPGADIGSDHIPIIARIHLKVECTTTRYYCLKKLKPRLEFEQIRYIYIYMYITSSLCLEYVKQLKNEEIR
jgi:hypothetical protein